MSRIASFSATGLGRAFRIGSAFALVALGAFVPALAAAAVPPLAARGVSPLVLGRSWLDSGASAEIYVGNVSTQTIDEYSKRGVLVGQIATPGQAWALTLDDAGNLYAAVWGPFYPSYSVLVYPPGATTPSRTLADGGAPMGIAVQHDGTVIVANYYTCIGSSCKYNGNVIAYPPGSTGQFVTYTQKSIDHPYHVAIADRRGVYVDGYDNSNPHQPLLGKFTSLKRFEPMGIALNDESGIVVDRSDDFAVLQYGTPGMVDVFAPGNTAPLRSFPLTGVPADGAPGLALSRRNRLLYTVTENASGTAYIAGFDYATGVLKFGPITEEGYCFGIAVSPQSVAAPDRRHTQAR